MGDDTLRSISLFPMNAEKNSYEREMVIFKLKRKLLKRMV